MYVALWCAEIRNAPNFSRQDRKPWTMDDFLQTPDAIARRNQRAKDEFANKQAAMRANAQLSTITKDTDVSGLPSWAVKKWGAA